MAIRIGTSGWVYKHWRAVFYPDDTLELWARKIRAWSGERKQVFVYFNNDAEGNAIRNALTLKELAKSVV